MNNHVPVILSNVPSPLQPEDARIAHASGELAKYLAERFRHEHVPTESSSMCLDDWLHLTNRPYIKDWHVNQTSQGNFFNCPSLFTDDWLNDWLVSTNNTDFRFLYWGDAGSGTAIHEDVLKTFSWSLNLNGRKLWKFYFDESVIEVIQTVGQAILVPPGLRHDVTNLDKDTISVNHNFFNSWSIHLTIDYLIEERMLLAKELAAFGAKVEYDLEMKSDNLELMMLGSCSLNFRRLSQCLLFNLEISSRAEQASFWLSRIRNNPELARLL